LVGLGTTYDVHLRLLGKRVGYVLLVLIALFAMLLQAGVGQYPPIFYVEGDVPTNHCRTELGQCLMPYNFVADSFTQRNFVAEFLRAMCDFSWKKPFCVFESSFERGGGLGATYDVHLKLIGKRVVDSYKC